jgi:TATA-box binding protein (TBP) (component of TFIID and TFIIIB)
VSTITCNGNLGCKINLVSFYDAIDVLEGDDVGTVAGIVWAKLGDSTQKGTHPKKRKPRIKKKMFDNQMTLVYWFREKYHPNVKVFRNGNVQMTGIKKASDGEFVISFLAQELIRLNAAQPSTIDAAHKILTANDNVPCMKDFVIRMINSDFKAPFSIRRKDLFTLIVNKYQKSCSFQAETYPGVKLQYYYNKSNSGNAAVRGTCMCTKPCFGKEKGDGNGKCKKVTVAIFQSGKILITGSNTFEQVEEAYAYIKKVILENKAKIHWTPPTLPVTGTIN